MPLTAKDYAEIYRRFQAPVSTRYDCGKKCAPINGGVPVCCDVENAIPIVDEPEWKLLKSRTKMWTPLKPTTPDFAREIKDLENSESCAIKCRGAAFCERDNRSLACRSFPYFPYFNTEGELIGISHYWGFEGSCWVIANPMIVERPFIDDFLSAHDYLFDRDEDWKKTYIEYSASMRRVFSRRKKKFLMLGRDGKRYWVLPHSGGEMVLAKREEIEKLKKQFPGPMLVSPE